MYVELGKIVGVWGVKGWIKLHSYSRNRIDIANYPNWWLQNKATDPVLIEVLACRKQGQGIVAKLAGIDDCDQAMALNGQRILVKQTDLPKLPEGKYYWQQLIGLTVANAEQAIGEITSILETGANDVLVVQRQDKSEVLIPHIDSVVKEVDLDNGSMLVDWDPSYLE